MYTVKKWHHRPTYRKGDLEAEDAVIDTITFKTRKAAKEFIESELRGKRNAWRMYHKGNEKSWCGYYTGKTWIHENTGETHEERFTYELAKA